MMILPQRLISLTPRRQGFLRLAGVPQAPQHAVGAKRVDHRRLRAPVHDHDIAFKRTDALIAGRTDLPIEPIAVALPRDVDRAAIAGAVGIASVDAVTAFGRVDSTAGGARVESQPFGRGAVGPLAKQVL